MRRQARAAFLAAPAVIAVALTAALSACGSTAAPQAGSSAAADPGGSSSADPGGSSAATHGAANSASGSTAAASRVPAVARQVQCPALRPGVGHLPASPMESDGPILAAEPIPPGFKPVAVVQCITVTSDTHGVFRLGDRKEAAVAGLGRLMAALREPSAAKPKGTLPACRVPLNSGPWFVLVSATGQVVRPLEPVGLCGAPIPQVLESLNSLHWITLSTAIGPGGVIRPPVDGGPVHDVAPVTAAGPAGAQ